MKAMVRLCISAGAACRTVLLCRYSLWGVVNFSRWFVCKSEEGPASEVRKVSRDGVEALLKLEKCVSLRAARWLHARRSSARRPPPASTTLRWESPSGPASMHISAIVVLARVECLGQHRQRECERLLRRRARPQWDGPPTSGSAVLGAAATE